MKILMFAKGSWVHTRRPLKWLLDAGQEVVFVDNDKPEAEESSQFRYVPYPDARATRLYSWLGEATYKRIAEWTIIMQLKWIRWKSKADVVHLHWLDKRAYRVTQAKLHPLILSVLGSDINKFFVRETSLEDREQIKKVLKNADMVLVDAEDMIEKCRQLAGGDINVKLLSVGIDVKKFKQDYRNEVEIWRKKLDIPPNTLILLSIRALGLGYNHDLIIQAFARVIQEVTLPAYLIIKNYNNFDPAYRTELQYLIRQLGIEAHIRWIQEYIPDAEVPVLYKLSDLIINYPRFDAFPVSFTEAAAAARPVISCLLPAYEKTFAEKYFRMIEANNVDELYNALVDYFSGKWRPVSEELAELQSWIQENQDESVSANHLINIYQELAHAIG